MYMEKMNFAGRIRPRRADTLPRLNVKTWHADKQFVLSG